MYLCPQQISGLLGGQTLIFKKITQVTRKLEEENVVRVCNNEESVTSGWSGLGSS